LVNIGELKGAKIKKKFQFLNTIIDTAQTNLNNTIYKENIFFVQPSYDLSV
jgi:hypothetical protein